MGIMICDLMTEIEYVTFTCTQFHTPKPSRINKKKANMFIKVKWFLLILIWKFNNRQWINCRQKTRALDKYKWELMKGYNI